MPKAEAEKRRPLPPPDHARVFAAFGDPTRLAIIGTLSDGRARSVSQLTAGSRLTRQAVSKHLRVLAEAGLVHSTRAGRESLYALRPEPLGAARAYLDRVAAQWDDALGRLRSFVEDEAAPPAAPPGPDKPG
jgi:DNA-binding transcriptional ArsR family regulator